MIAFQSSRLSGHAMNLREIARVHTNVAKKTLSETKSDLLHSGLSCLFAKEKTPQMIGQGGLSLNKCFLRR